MGSALVVGDIGSGLTTFVGLLYTAQLRLGTEEADEFRFSADRETIRQLEAIYGELGSGRFPERDVNWEEHPLSFLFGFRSGVLGGLRPGSSEDEDGFDTVRVQVGGISAQEIAELAQHDAILEESTRRLLRSRVVLPLVDASRLVADPEDPLAAALVRYDRLLASTLGVVARFIGAERSRKLRRMYPLFVVTKFDRCPPATLKLLGAPAAAPAQWPSEEREKVGRGILERFLPQVRKFFEGASRARDLHIEDPRWFFSSLASTDGPQGPRIARRSRVPIGAWEPEYPFEEYRALILELGRLARRLPRAESGP